MKVRAGQLTGSILSIAVTTSRSSSGSATTSAALPGTANPSGRLNLPASSAMVLARRSASRKAPAPLGPRLGPVGERFGEGGQARAAGVLLEVPPERRHHLTGLRGEGTDLVLAAELGKDETRGLLLIGPAGRGAFEGVDDLRPGHQVEVVLVGEHSPATVVPGSDRGLIRQVEPKSSTGRRTVPLTRDAVDALRTAAALNLPGGEFELWFPNLSGGLRQPGSVRSELARLVRGTELAWVTTHTMRKTAATAVARAYDDATAAALLGHSGVGSLRHYVQRSHQAPDVRDVLERAAR
ncbi:site-specific integrase [Cellulomonas iranensis]|uniref:site-specific integrase n=1 Tax=Cellulomonas iranensis TaxID=76862 RepID=UPI001CF5EE5E|nr:site-specific integrase [Cellulomonas iranensis]UCN14399.1 site-specific integrase [Cellulomonas iranensis]